MLKGAPSVQIQDVPPDTYWGSDDEDLDIDFDSRKNQKDLDKYIQHQNDFYDDENDMDKDKENPDIFSERKGN